LEQERNKDESDLTSKNHKLQKKIDRCKSELNDAKQDISALKSQLEQTRQDKVIREFSYDCRLFRKKNFINFNS